ncbi:MAG: hypothetical protein HY074_06775 [Deltaproteobacteria bacterium]|nr:hypothetical protein [Deltaproteobacteria bacterium]
MRNHCLLAVIAAVALAPALMAADTATAAREFTDSSVRKMLNGELNRKNSRPEILVFQDEAFSTVLVAETYTVTNFETLPKTSEGEKVYHATILFADEERLRRDQSTHLLCSEPVISDPETISVVEKNGKFYFDSARMTTPHVKRAKKFAYLDGNAEVTGKEPIPRCK